MENKPTVKPEKGAFKVGNLVSLNLDEYPSLGKWFVQLWDGEAVVARIYGDDRDELKRRIELLNGCKIYLDMEMHSNQQKKPKGFMARLRSWPKIPDTGMTLNFMGFCIGILTLCASAVILLQIYCRIKG